jgi:glutamate synthase (NADPH/NADH) small chain
MPRQEAAIRAKNFKEVALGYTPEMAAEEASRCIQCPKRPCVEGCPVNVDIPEFVKAVREGRMTDAVIALKNKNALPGICGRVCPQETQCESVCTLEKKGAPIAIGRLEIYVADWERMNKASAGPAPEKPAPTGSCRRNSDAHGRRTSRRRPRRVGRRERGAPPDCRSLRPFSQ